MKAYLITTGTLFALVTLAHLARTPEISQRASTDPWFVIGYTLLTILAAALSIWAWRLVRRLGRAR
jgi:protein-S-isoprenylcysteine O-methyltransferase Ste14